MVALGEEGCTVTPTLRGRWQTRLATLGTIGVAVTLVFALRGGGFEGTFFAVLAWVAVLGVAWDGLWIALQGLRWDRDWPPLLQWAGAAVEGAALYSWVDRFGLPGVTAGGVSLELFAAHYGTVFATVFVFLQGPVRVLLPRWRFNGGRIV